MRGGLPLVVKIPHDRGAFQDDVALPLPEQAAAQVQLLTTAETKLTAAIVAALLSTRGGNANA